MTTRQQLQRKPQGKHRPSFIVMGGLATWLRNVPYGTKRQFYRFTDSFPARPEVRITYNVLVQP